MRSKGISAMELLIVNKVVGAMEWSAAPRRASLWFAVKQQQGRGTYRTLKFEKQTRFTY
jgi:hypothetical protein